MEQLEQQKPQQKQNSRRIKSIIGMLLLLMVVYVIWTHVDFSRFTGLGIVVQGPKTTCTQIKGPETMTQTVMEKLRVLDESFSINDEERRATLSVKNIDDVPGTVRVMLYCKNGDQQGEDKKTIGPQETEQFTFLDVAQCDLDYIIEPELIKHTLNKTVSITDTVCE